MLKYLSPSALKVWERDRDEFYLCYLAQHSLKRFEQIRAAAIGSAFDARVKSHLASDLFGTVPESLEFEPLFTAQVDPEHQAWSRVECEYVFECYARSGRYHELLAILEVLPSPPIFEGKLQAIIEGVPLGGFPDLSFTSTSGIRVVLDWKLRGYCSKYAKSPTKRYVLCRDGWSHDCPPTVNCKKSRNHNKPHPDARLTAIDGILCHEGFMEEADTYYADQLAIYLWLLGEEPATANHLTIIDEIVAKPVDDARPQLRISTLSARISNLYQTNLLARLRRCWGQLQAGHIFDELPYADSVARCEHLDRVSVSQATSGGNIEDEFRAYLKSQFRYG